MDAAFWQRLLAADMSPERCRAVLRSLGNVSLTEATLERHANRLSPVEREAMARADMGALERVLSQGAAILPGNRYPERLALAPGGPPAIFVWGDQGCLAAPAVAMVGTRAASIYGRASAQKFAEAFAVAGVTVVSGGAAGIDAAAHEGAMNSGGKTVAVLGTGIERAYPAMHRDLFARIRANGCLVSQFAAGTGPKPFRFPIRNHLIAALSDVVVVIEAHETSGSLITAHASAELGRQVFVVPANITNVGFRGSHALIRDGATLVDHPDQVLEALNVRPVAVAAGAPPTSAVQTKILDALAVRPLSAEMIVDQTGVSASEALSELTILELEGRVIRDGMSFALKS